MVVSTVSQTSGVALEARIGGVQHGRADETRRGEVPVGAFDRCEASGREPAVVHVERLTRRHVENGAVDRVGSGAKVRMEPDAEGDRSLLQRLRPCRDAQSFPAHVVLNLQEEGERVAR